MWLSIQGATVANNTTPPIKTKAERTLTEDSAKPNESAQTTANDHHPDIFDKQFAVTMNGFGEACETQGINTAVAIAIHPQGNGPLVFMRGHEYDVAVMLTRLLRSLKEKLGAELEV